MSLSVLSVAYPLAPVGADAVGGAEQVLTHIDAALSRAGHRSFVLACEGSETAGTLIPVPRVKGVLTEEARRAAQALHAGKLREALDRLPVDLVHLHGIDFHTYLPPPGVPVLVTLHLPPAWYPQEVFRPRRPRTYLHCVSGAQRRACPPGAVLLPEIENGVPLPPPAAHARRRFVLGLGRVCPEKGFHLALDAAARAGVPMLLAGEVFRYEAHERYFAEEIRPRLDRWRRFLGPVGLRRKRRLLAARCLLVPSLAPETSSLVAMEALACGTPVVAFPAGALAEVVTHGETGYLVHDVGEMADAIRAVGSLSREACREAARSRFALGRMTESYLSLYRRLATADEPASRGREPPGSLTVQEVTTTEGLEALRPEWSALWARCPSATPFQSPEWLLPWWRHFGGTGLWTLALRHAGRLVGLAPLFVWRNPESSARTVLLLGTGISDYLDALFDPCAAEAGAAAVLAHLAANAHRWDLCDFQQLRAGGQLLEAPLPPGWLEKRDVGDVCPVLPLPAAATGQTHSAGLRYLRRRAEALGPVRVEQAGPDNFAELFEALVRLHGARWDSNGLPGVLADRSVRHFHREAAAALLRSGVLRLYGFRIGGCVVAAFYGFAARGRTYYYLSGFDPELNRLSLGSQVVAHAITEAAHEGSAEFDFLRGREAYKYRWGAQDRPTYRRLFWDGG